MRKTAMILSFLLFAFLCPWQAAACDCDTVYFLVSDKWGTQSDATSYSSYVLPLSDEQDKEDARTLIQQVKHYRNTPEDPFPTEPGHIVTTKVAWGPDGMNRNHLVVGKPEWWWHVSEFVAFTPFGLEVLDGGPETAHLYNIGFGAIGFWSYTVTAELGPALCLHVTPEPGALRFRWTNLSTNAAYVGTNYIYTLEARASMSDEWLPVPGGEWPMRQTEWVQLGGAEPVTQFYRIRPELLDEPSWEPVPRDCETVFFKLSRASGAGHLTAASSFVLPLSNEQDQQHARALIKHFKETPEEPLPQDPGASVIVAVAWGGDGINRNHLVPGSPPWPWHVARFLAFTPFTGIPGVHDMPEWVYPSTETVSFKGYLITEELGPALCLSVFRAAEGLLFQWTDLSTNEAYPGTNWVYTVETRELQSENWVPAPGGDWPTRQTEWMQAPEDGMPVQFYRLSAEYLEE